MDDTPIDLGTVRVGPFLIGGHRVDEWLVTLVMAVIAGQTGICEVHVEPAPVAVEGASAYAASIDWARATLTRFGHLVDAEPPAQSLTVVGLRGIPLGAFAAAHWETDRASNEMYEKHPGASVVVGFPGKWSWDLTSDLDGDGLRALTASRYVDLVQSGHRHPLQQLADELGVSVSGVRARLAQARAAGFLTPARKGVAGGELTDAGRAMLKRFWRAPELLAERSPF